MRVIALLLSSVLAACTMLQGPASLPELPLLEPADFGQELQLSQRVTVDFDGESQTLLAAWAVSGEQLSFAGLTPAGQRLMMLGYGAEGFAEEYSPLLAEPLPGREVLSHLQLAHWPLDVIQQALDGSGWRISQSASGRELYFQNRLALSISADYESTTVAQVPATIHMRSHLMPLKLRVETVQVSRQ